jgi:hypothetical protein
MGKLYDATLDGPGGDKAADLLITENMRLIGSAITRFTMLHPDAEYLVDDLFSEGLLALTTAIRTLVKFYKDNPEKLKDFLDHAGGTEGGKYNFIGYIYVTIYRMIQRCYEIDSSNPISKRMRERHTPKGCDKPTRQVDMPPDFFTYLTTDAFDEVYALENIEGACTEVIDFEIVHLRLVGKTLDEIAEILDIGQASVWRHRKALYQRYCKQQGISE